MPKSYHPNSTTRSRCRRKFREPTLRIMDLLGVGKDGTLYLWEAAQKVRPISTFERNGSGIVSGHYVIEHSGAAVTVHCGNLADGRVSVQFMCGGLETLRLARKFVEAMLLGRVIPDAVKAAEITELLRQAAERLEARQTAPHLRRGTL